jgi:hypothetical protein
VRGGDGIFKSNGWGGWSGHCAGGTGRQPPDVTGRPRLRHPPAEPVCHCAPARLNRASGRANRKGVRTRGRSEERS